MASNRIPVVGWERKAEREEERKDREEEKKEEREEQEAEKEVVGTHCSSKGGMQGRWVRRSSLDSFCSVLRMHIMGKGWAPS